MRIDALDHFAVELEHKAQDAVGRGMLRPEIDLKIAERAFGHQSAPASACARFALSATRALNLSHFTTKRSCSPPPILSMPS